MRYRLILPLLTLLMASTSYALPEADRIQSAYGKAQDWRADFLQTSYVELLDRHVKKKGSIIIKKPGKLLITYDDSPKKTYRSDGKKLWIHVDGDPQVEVYKKASKMLPKESLGFLEGFGTLKKDFVVMPLTSVRAKELMIKQTDQSLLELIPRNKNSSFERLILAADRKTGLVQELTLVNVSGTRTHYTFSNIRLNTSPADTLFSPVSSDGVREIER